MQILVLHHNINGMGLIDFSIEPHFDIENREVLNELKEYSKDVDIYALEDDSFIVIKDNQEILYGNVYMIKDEKVIKINSVK